MHLYCMCQILVFNAINAIVTDMEYNVKIDRLLLGRGTDHDPWAVCVSSYCLHISNYYIKVGEQRRGNQKWTIQRNWQHWVHNTHDEDNQRTHNTEN
jgi:hypothetical protein